jgi:serine/threonine-protein kinase
MDTSPSASSSPGTLNASPEHPVTDSSAPSPQQVHHRSAHQTTPRPARTAPQLLAATLPGALQALSRMRRSVDAGLAASEVRVDVAVDLDNVISSLQAQLATGAHVDVNQRVSELRTKIAQRVREGGLAQNRANDLTQALSAI